MGRYSEPVHATLECECGERIIVFGLEEDWRSRRAIFLCECGEKLNFDNNRVEVSVGFSATA